VAECTGAEIYWPSRLKIGAKTKKDPFVKVSGTPSQVDGARQMINTYLKIKRDRVTLKIEIHHSEHSKIIGRQGRNTQDIMRKTMCHIHFPDSNKNHEAEKNDQFTAQGKKHFVKPHCTSLETIYLVTVSISGSVEQVERARKWLRDLTPLSLTFELPNRPYQSFHDIQKSVNTKGIYITFRENYDGHLTCFIKSTQQYESAIVKSVGEIAKFFQCPLNIPCQTVLTVRSSLRAVVNKDDSLQHLSAQTNTTIRPAMNESDEINIHISGPIFGILHARRSLIVNYEIAINNNFIGLLPVSVHFDRVVEPNSDLFDKHVIEATYGVTVSEKWRKCQGPSKVSLVVVVSTERYVSDLFRVRERILNILPESRGNLHDQIDENRSFSPRLIADSGNLEGLRTNNVCDQHKSSGHAILKKNDSVSLPHLFRDMNSLANENQSALAESLIDQSFSNSICQKSHFEQKTPDPTHSPIAHSVLAGAKRIDEKRAQKRSQSREQLLLKANRATYDPSLTPVRQPTDFWAGYGFSNSLPAEVLKNGLGLFDGTANGQFEARTYISQESKVSDATVLYVQSQFTNGLSSVLEEDEYNGNSSSNSNSFLSSSSFHNFQHLQQSLSWQPKQGFSASTSVFDVGNDVKWDIRVFVDPAMVLAQLGCSEYLPQFREQEIDMEAFLLLDEKSLQDIGVSTIGARKKLFNAIISTVLVDLN
ncbi:unnamed protein product, partial [Enterobius vermicularis]|uniref:SAM domain-containing protein n=1 Tax=Enterobius vermicularis TaxID=51028 RepID=A0A0N4V7V5_ENTVE